MPLIRWTAVVALVVTATACSPSKPTKQQCSAACVKSFDLHHAHVLKGARAMAGDDEKKAEENVAKAQAEWEKMKKSGRETKRIDDCTLTCMAEGTAVQIECMTKATSIQAVRNCKTP